MLSCASMEQHLKVIIRCLVYNHEPYLRDCLDGFVMQKTNFPFKAVVHDDCSTDGSAAIIREYAEKYPDIIEPIYETENLYSMSDGSLGRVMAKACNGRSEYIALCEGDDYWIDSHKLQKQVDYMDAHPESSMCFSSAEILNKHNIEHNFNGDKIEDRYYSATEVFQKWIVPTASICVRANVLNDKRFTTPDSRRLFGDIALILSSADYGKLYGMKDTMVVYRIHAMGVSHDTNRAKMYEKGLPAHYRYILDNFKNVDKAVVVEMHRNACMRIISADDFSKYEKLCCLLQIMRYELCQGVCLFVSIIFNMLKKLIVI